MSDLRSSEFREFFLQLHGKAPFPWQERLAEQVSSEGWPQVIDLPTASGKTACIDIALFALALRGKDAPRRIFFVVDRRVVVNEAFERTKKIAEQLRQADGGILNKVARRLRELAGSDEACPLETYELRGGAYRDERWVITPLQSTVVVSTVDQVGSRLLFRGYGVSPNTWPMHAGLIANDALIFLDEAHCSGAFAQTLQSIERYRSEQWAETPLNRPFRFVEMTATPAGNQEGRVFRIDEVDREDNTLGQRLRASKPTRLVEVKGKRDDLEKLADALASEAIRLAAECGATRIAVMVNRVRTAKLVRSRLQKKAAGQTIHLVIGRMRPVDRDDLYRLLLPLKSGASRMEGAPPRFVVSTQCLEVGADLDFDVLVTECASIDALLQRFGRLDRLGAFGRAAGSIVALSGQMDAKKPDEVYGEALAYTWKSLSELQSGDGLLAMGIEAKPGDAATVAQQLGKAVLLRTLGKPAPTLLPSHLDAFAQTSPVPEPDPEPALFLHGRNKSAPDVQLIWRADLDGADEDKWREIVAVCPPSSNEAMPVPISAFRKWFAGESNPSGEESDLQGVGQELHELPQQRGIKALVWRGNEDNNKPVSQASHIRPGDTVVLPKSAGGWDVLGHIPGEKPIIDLGDRARWELRRRVCLRLHPNVVAEWPKTKSREELLKVIKRNGAEDEIPDALADCECTENPEWINKLLFEMRGRPISPHPSGVGYVIEGRITKSKKGKAGDEVLLRDHSEDVEEAARELVSLVTDSDQQRALQTAARFHDYGKADVRYQAWLRGGDVMAAQYAPQPLAKSKFGRLGKQVNSGLPDGFRHELLSLLFAEKFIDATDETRDLTLHLIASHHGRVRPFAPVVSDNAAECVTFQGISVCKREREECTTHRLDSGAADRFWKLTRQYGWWGLAYLEALFRLADWQASDEENAEGPE